MIGYLCILQNDHHNKSNYHLSPYIVTEFFLVMITFKIYSVRKFQIYDTVLVTVIIMLYVTFPGLTYFIPGSLYLLSPFTPFAHPPAPPAPPSLAATVSMSLVFAFLFLFRFH